LVSVQQTKCFPLLQESLLGQLLPQEAQTFRLSRLLELGQSLQGRLRSMCSLLAQVVEEALALDSLMRLRLAAAASAAAVVA